MLSRRVFNRTESERLREDEEKRDDDISGAADTTGGTAKREEEEKELPSELVFKACQLTSLPASIGRFRWVRDIDISFNALTSLPMEICKLHQLESLVRCTAISPSC